MQYLKWPRAARQMVELGALTRLKNVFSAPLPITVLAAANLRECTGSRAPAIMSALGVTDWYGTTKADGQDLVLGTYPLAFVREAAATLGATFYISLAYDYEIPSGYQALKGRFRGSMLPFAHDTAQTRTVSRHIGVPHNIQYEAEDHPAVSSWRVNLDGSVTIRRVGILASNKDSENQNLRMVICIMSPKSKPQQCNFDDWVSQLPKNQSVYAVSLLRDSNFQHGIILQGIKMVRFFKQHMVRVGIFFTRAMNFPKVSYVDWLAI